MMEDGIYFGLVPDETYHPDPALGSGDIRACYHNASEYWWNSPFNPVRPKRKSSRYLDFGRAVHARVLEGEQAFFQRAQCEYTGKDLIKTDAQLKDWIKNTGNKPVSGVKGDRIDQALAIDPKVSIDEVINERAEKAGRTIFSEDDWNRILMSATLIQKNPDLERAFDGGYPEVAIVYTETVGGEKVRCKALFDYLKPRGIGDLKSTSNPKGLEFASLCKIRFSEYRMDIQAAHYLRAREFIPQFVDEGRVFGDHDKDWLRRVADTTEFGFAFVFHQTTGAPSTWSLSLSPGNQILDFGNRAREDALDKYARYRSKFGAEAMWLSHEPMRELDITELPAWYARR